MPGSPATTAHFGAPRYADSDTASFSEQVNGVADVFDTALGERDEKVTVQGADYAASVGDCVIASAPITITLPAAPGDQGAVTVVALSTDSTVNRSGTDTLTDYSSTGGTSSTVKAGTRTKYRYHSGVWYVQGHEKPIAHAASHEDGGADEVVGLFKPGDLIFSAARARDDAILADGTAYTLSAHPELATLASACPDFVSGGVFTVPDLRGRAPVGAGTGAGLSVRSLGAKGGEESHILSVAEMPSHNHTGATAANNASHSHGYSGSTSGETAQHTHIPEANGGFITGSGGTFYSFFGGGNAGVLWIQSITGPEQEAHVHTYAGQTGTQSANHLHGVFSDGGGSAHNNMQPHAVLNAFIKT